MLDKNGNKLLKPSPLKMSFWSDAGDWLFGNNDDKNNAQKEMQISIGALEKMAENLVSKDVTNPFADYTNAYAGLDNKMADLDNQMTGLDNVYDDAENVYEGKMKNVFQDQKNA